jgi:hypothetical protein
VLTSDGTANGAIAESGLTYDQQYLTLYGGQRTQTVDYATVSPGTTVIESFPSSTGSSCHFEYVVIEHNLGYRRSGVVMGVWDDSFAEFTEYSTPDLGGSTLGIEFRVVVVGADVQLQASVSVGDWDVKVNTRIIF